MEHELRISLAELRAAFNGAVDRLVVDEGETVALNRDYFWSIAPEDLYNPYARPNDLGIGQLSESWRNVRRTLEDEDMAIRHDLVWLADVLRALGHAETRA